MKKCKACQKEIDVKASKCPHCQSDQRNWFLRHPILTVLFALIIIGAVGSADNSRTSSQVNTSSNTKNTADTINVANEQNKQEDNKPKQWETVTELSGDANKRSDTFELKGG